MTRAKAQESMLVGKRCCKLTLVDSADISTDGALDHMAYLPDMDSVNSPILDEVLDAVTDFNFERVTSAQVREALAAEVLSVAHFGALLSSAAEPFLEQMARRAQGERRRWFGSSVQIFTPLYLANHCENHCVYCGFNCTNNIHRTQLDEESIVRELDAIAATGLEEVLLLTGEDPLHSSVAYIARACELAAVRFKTVGVEVYPMNTSDYECLRASGADFVTVFQETYDPARYEQLHLAGRKRVFPYRFEAQERALKAGMRGVAFAVLLGVADFRRDAFACGLHGWKLQRAYPHAELSFSCPRLRPAKGGELPECAGVSERQLLQILCALRLFMPFAGMTISSRERAGFRDEAAALVATKVSAGVSTGVGTHAGGQGGNTETPADDQFEIADDRNVAAMAAALRERGLEMVTNDHVLV